MAKHQIDIPEETLHQLEILKGVGRFKNIPETLLYAANYNLGELVSKKSRTLRREILKEKEGVKATIYAKEDVDSKATRIKREKEKKDGI